MEYIILWIFALFGIWSLVSNIVEGFYLQNNIGKFDVLLKVYNQEESIELLIRELSKVDMVGKIRIIDNNSTDRTLDIVERIKISNPKVVLENDT